jgi:hypothetical protein
VVDVMVHYSASRATRQEAAKVTIMSFLDLTGTAMAASGLR